MQADREQNKLWNKMCVEPNEQRCAKKENDVLYLQSIKLTFELLESFKMHVSIYEV